MKKLAIALAAVLLALTLLGCPSHAPKHEEGELVGQLPGDAQPAAPVKADSPSSATQPQGDSTAAKAPEKRGIVESVTVNPAPKGQKPKLTEDLYIAISAKLVLAAKRLSDTPTGRKTLEDYTATVLRENGITPEEFKDYTAQLRQDKKRMDEVAELILTRAEKYAGPGVKIRDGQPMRYNPPPGR